MVQVTRDKARHGKITEQVNDRTFGVLFDAAAAVAYYDVDKITPVIDTSVPEENTNIAVKYDQQKTRIELIPASAIEAAGRAFTFGATKYSEHNWANGFEWDRLVGSTLRHINAWRSGEDTDPESGLSHLDHALATLMMLKAHEAEGLGNDNRRKTIR